MAELYFIALAKLIRLYWVKAETRSSATVLGATSLSHRSTLAAW